MAAPMPFEAPVTTATWPASFFEFVLIFIFVFKLDAPCRKWPCWSRLLLGRSRFPSCTFETCLNPPPRRITFVSRAGYDRCNHLVRCDTDLRERRCGAHETHSAMVSTRA